MARLTAKAPTNLRAEVIAVPHRPPTAPQLGQVTAVSASSLRVPLSIPSLGTLPISSYELEASNSAIGPWQLIASGALIFGSSGYVETGLSAQQERYYRARGFDSSQRESPYSAVVAGLTQVTSDTLAPTVPVISVASIATGVRLSIYGSTDHQFGSAPGSGLDKYRVQVDGSDLSSDVAAAATNILGTSTPIVIGSFSPAAGSSQSGDAVTVHCAGTGLDGTADQIAGRYWQRNDDFFATFRVASLAGPGIEWGFGGLQARASLAAGAPHFSLFQFLNGAWQAKVRDATDGMYASIGNAATPGGPAVGAISRVGNTFTAYLRNAAGELVQVAQRTIAMGSSVFIVPLASSLTPDVEINATIDQISITSASPQTIDVTTSVAVALRVSARDRATQPNISAYSPSIVKGPASATGNIIKMGRGFYERFQAPPINGINFRHIDLVEHKEAAIARLQYYADKPWMQGLQIEAFWSAMEGDTPGDYASRIASFTEILDAAHYYGKTIILVGPLYLWFGGSPNGLYTWFPRYLIDDPQYGGLYYGATGVVMIWKQSVLARFNECVKAWGVINGHPALVVRTFAESSFKEPPAGTGGSEPWSPQALINTYKSIHKNARIWNPNVNIIFGANDMPNVGSMSTAMVDCEAPDVYAGMGGPDVYLGDSTWADGIYRGRNPANSFLADGVYYDRISNGVARVPWMVQAQTQSVLGRWTAAQLHDAVMGGYAPENGVPAFLPAVCPFWMVIELANQTWWDTSVIPLLQSRWRHGPNPSPMYSWPKPSLYPGAIVE